MNNNDEINEEQMKEPAAAMQTDITRQEEDLDRQEPAATPESMQNGSSPFLNAEEIDELQSRWNSIQIEFVDDPRACVEQADGLVVETLERIEQALSNQRTGLARQWTHQADISTEDLRIALQSYRSFLNRLLAL